MSVTIAIEKFDALVFEEFAEPTELAMSAVAAVTSSAATTRSVRILTYPPLEMRLAAEIGRRI
jgi:hypothetical protein